MGIGMWVRSGCIGVIVVCGELFLYVYVSIYVGMWVYG